MLNFVHKFSYKLVWIFARPIFSFFFHFQVETKKDLKSLKNPLIIVSDHASWIDPFFIAAAFPFQSKIFPIRYACWYRYFYSFRTLPFALLLGAFPIRKGIEFEEALHTPFKILENKGVVGLFPEGKRKLGGRPRKARRGAAYLFFKTKVKILPVKIEGNFNMNFINFILRRYKIKIKIGEPFSLPPQKINQIEDLNQPSDFIMSKIREL